MDEHNGVTVRIAQRHDYEFENRFGAEVPPLLTDEPPPLGSGRGPSPVELLAASVGNCLAASLLFAIRKFKQDPGTIGCEVTANVGRNADKRLRVLSMLVQLRLGVAGPRIEHLDRALAGFEEFCTVTASVRAAIPVSVEVFDGQGARLK
jgi:uncharacterized OsmC-like protein